MTLGDVPGVWLGIVLQRFPKLRPAPPGVSLQTHARFCFVTSAGRFTASRTSVRTTAARSTRGRSKVSASSVRANGATFDVLTGDALTLPAVMPLMTFPVSVQGDDVLVDV